MKLPIAFPRGLLFCCAISLLARAPSSFAQEPAANPPTADQQTIDTWVAELDDPQYQTRQAAMRKLLELGNPAIDALLAATKDGSPERGHRALQILIKLAAPTDPEEPNPALDALQTLADRQVSSITANAKNAVMEIRRDQSKIAQTKLQLVGVAVGFGELTIKSGRVNDRHVRVPLTYNGTAHDLRWVRWLYGLEYLVAEGPAIDGDVLGELAQMPDLKYFILYKPTRLTAEGLKRFSTAPPLHHVELMYLTIDEGAGDAIASLPLRNSLKIIGQILTDAELIALENRHPNVSISQVSGAFLGVSCNPTDPTCLVQQVVDNSAAAIAGIRAGDIILKIEEFPIANYDALRNTIAKLPTGKNLKVEIFRENQPMELQIKLGEARP